MVSLTLTFLPPNLDRAHSQLGRRGGLSCRLIHAATALWPIKTNHDVNKEGLRMQQSQTIYIYRRPDGDKGRQRIVAGEGGPPTRPPPLHPQPDKPTSLPTQTCCPSRPLYMQSSDHPSMKE